MADISEWGHGNVSPSVPTRTDSERHRVTPADAWTPVEEEGSRTTITTNLPNSIQYLPDERDVKLPEHSSHLQFVHDWEAGRLECSAMPAFVAARGTFEAGRAELAKKYKYDPRGEYAAKLRLDHKKKISNMTDWWLTNDGRRRNFQSPYCKPERVIRIPFDCELGSGLVTASGLGKIAPDFSMDPPLEMMSTFSMDTDQPLESLATRLASREVTRVPSPMTVSRHHGQDQTSADVIASHRDIRSSSILVPKARARMSRSAASTPLPMSGTDAGEDDPGRTGFAATFSGGEGRPGVQEELFKYLDNTYATRSATQKRLHDQTEMVFAASMNRIQTKLKAGEHLFSLAYRQRHTKSRQPISNGETMYAVQSVYSARKWRCRPVIAHISDVLRQPMRYTLLSAELFDELGRGTRLLRPDEWDDLERRFQCLGGSAKALDCLKAGDIAGAMANSVNLLSGASTTTTQSTQDIRNMSKDGVFAQLTNPRNRTLESAPVARTSMFPISSVQHLIEREKTRPMTAGGTSLVRPRRALRAKSASSTSTAQFGNPAAVNDFEGEGSASKAPGSELEGVEVDDGLSDEESSKTGQVEEGEKELPVEDERASQTVNPLDLFDDEGLAQLLKKTPMTMTVRDSAKRRLEGLDIEPEPQEGRVGSADWSGSELNDSGVQNIDEREQDSLMKSAALEKPDDGSQGISQKPGMSTENAAGTTQTAENQVAGSEVQTAHAVAGGGAPSHSERPTEPALSHKTAEDTVDGQDRRTSEPPLSSESRRPPLSSERQEMLSLQSPVTSITLSPKLPNVPVGSSVKLVMAGYDVGARVSLPKLLEPLKLHPKPRTLRWAMQMLSHACVDKMLADAADVGAGQPRSRFSLYLRQWAQRRWGFSTCADQQLVDLCATLRRYKDATMEAKLLWRCCTDKLSAGQLALFLNARELLSSVSSIDGDRFSTKELTAASATVPIRFVHSISNLALSFASKERRKKALRQLCDEGGAMSPLQGPFSPPPIGLWKPDSSEIHHVHSDDSPRAVRPARSMPTGDMSSEPTAVNLDRTLLKLVTAYGSAVKELRAQLKERYEDMLDEMTRGMPRDGKEGRPLGSCVPVSAMIRFVQERYSQVPPERFEMFLAMLMEGGARSEGQLVDFETLVQLDDAVDLMGYDTRWEQIGNGDLRLLVDEGKRALWAQHNLDLTTIHAPRRLMKASMIRIAKQSDRRLLRRSFTPSTGAGGG